jgi:DNA-binding beta-propeller fold protein YncE
MEAADLGYKPVPTACESSTITMGAPSGVGITSEGHLIVFNRGPNALLEFDSKGAFVRTLGQEKFVRPHGFRIDPQGNLWVTDVNGHTLTKMSRQGEVLLTLGTKGQAGEWNEAAGTRLLNEPTDLAFGANGEIFLLQGHGRGEPRMLKFDRTGKLLKTWGGLGSGGQFDTSHSVVVDRKGLVYVAIARTPPVRSSTATANHQGMEIRRPAVRPVLGTWRAVMLVSGFEADPEARREWQGDRHDRSARQGAR